MSDFFQISFRFLSDSCQVSHFIKSFEWITFFVSARMCYRFLQVGLRFLLKLHVFGRDEGCIGQGQPAPTTQSNATRQRGELVVDDVVVLEVLLKLIDIINLHHQTQTFADEHEEGVDQRLGGFAADISFLSFVVLLHLLIRQALGLGHVCELNANGLFGLASRNKDGQLLAFGGNVVAPVRDLPALKNQVRAQLPTHSQNPKCPARWPWFIVYIMCLRFSQVIFNPVRMSQG